MHASILGVAAILVCAGVACGGGRRADSANEAANGARGATARDGSTRAMEVHDSGGRPRLAIVRREGDPSAGVAIELRVATVGAGTTIGDASVRSAAVAALLAARIEEIGGATVNAYPGIEIARIRALVPRLGAPLASKIDAALVSAVRAGEPGVVAARRALEALWAHPVDDEALSRASRCLEHATRPRGYRPPGPSPADDALPAMLERWRESAVRAGSVVIGVVGAGGGVDELARQWRLLPPMRGDNTVVADTRGVDGATAWVGASPDGREAAVLVLEGLARGGVPGAIASLLDPRGALTLRLRAADDWRIRGVAGAARPEGGCIVIEVEPAATSRGSSMSPADPRRDWNAGSSVSRAAVALEIARREAELAIDAGRASGEAEAARLAISSGSDPREAADRAAWWAWPSRPPSRVTATSTLLVPLASLTSGASGVMVATGANGKTGSTASDGISADVDAALAKLRVRLATSVDRARLAWARSELDLRNRVEAGQGELWTVLGSPCGVAHERDADAGLGNLSLKALASDVSDAPTSYTSPISVPRIAIDGVTLEPWGSTRGLGLLAHAPARAGESQSALAHRVGDAVGRVFLASFPTSDHLASARGEIVAGGIESGGEVDLVRAALASLAPRTPSAFDASGTAEAVAKAGLDSVMLRLSTLRSGPLRLAVLANADPEQVEAVARAVERWVPRRPGEARACPTTEVEPPNTGSTGKGAIHALSVRSGAGLAFAFPVEEADRDVAALIASALDGPTGRISAELLRAPLATSHSVKLVRGSARDALVVVFLAPEANLDELALRARRLFDALRGGALDAEDLARTERLGRAASLQRRLDPRARVTDLFLGESPPAGPPDLTRVRAVAARVLDEARAHVVVARLRK